MSSIEARRLREELEYQRQFFINSHPRRDNEHEDAYIMRVQANPKVAYAFSLYIAQLKSEANTNS